MDLYDRCPTCSVYPRRPEVTDDFWESEPNAPRYPHNEAALWEIARHLITLAHEVEEHGRVVTVTANQLRLAAQHLDALVDARREAHAGR